MYGQRSDYGPFLAGARITGAGLMLAFAGGVFLFVAGDNADARKIALIIVATGFVVFVFGVVRFFWLRHAVGRADLILDDPIPFGYGGTATYYRPLRGVEMRSIEARLQCEEEIVKGRGKHKTHKTKVVYDAALAPVVLPMSTRIEVQVPFRIPEAGPASFRCSVAQTKWFIRLRLEMSGCPNTASSFEIRVAPERLQ